MAGMEEGEVDASILYLPPLFFSFGCARSYLKHMGPFSCSMGDLVP